MSTPTRKEIRAAENERLRTALHEIREHIAKVGPGDIDAAYYGLGAIDATAAIALGEAVYSGEAR